MNPVLAQKIFGVLNITEDSFFDGGCYLSKEQVEQQAKNLIQQGAGILDLGAASSHPDSKEITVATEISRLQSAIEFCKKQGVKISVDSYLSEVQLYAMSQGVDFLNDIAAFGTPSIYPQLAASHCKLVLMHSVQRKGKADRRELTGDIVERIIDFFSQRIETLVTAGIARNRIILDTGMGFFLSSNPDISFQVLQNLASIKRIFQLPILIGVSRKSFLQKTVQKPVEEIGAVGGYLEMLLLEQGVDYIRTHSPHFLQDFSLIKSKISFANKLVR